VIGMKMTDHQQRDVVDVQHVQATIHRRGIRTDIDDDHPAVSSREHKTVPLTDVAHHQYPPRSNTTTAEHVLKDQG